MTFRRCLRNRPKTILFVTLFLYLIASILFATLSTRNQYNKDTSSSGNWVLVGGITSSSVSFRIRRNHNDEDNPVGLRLIVATVPSESDDSSSSSSIAYDQRLNDDVTDGDNDDKNEFVTTVDVSGLESNTRYFYRTISDNGKVLRRGSFQTPSPEGIPMNFTIATAGCAWTGSKATVFSTILAEENPLLFLHLGDFHYEDLNTERLEVRINALDKVLGSNSQAELFRNVGLVYIWDDHDWLGNDSGGSGIGAKTALESYRVAFPFYTPLPAAAAALASSFNDTDGSSEQEEISPYHAFTIGTIRFIVTDLRSQATEESIYSPEQKDWLFDEISNSSAYDFVVLITSKPWIGEAEAGDDKRQGHPKDRSELSDWISQTVGGPNGKQNLLVLSADAHMVAFDNGMNTYYGTNTSMIDVTSFPILQSGPLDRLGSVKGGPFSDGCYTTLFERNHQYSTIEFQIPSTGDGDGEPCLVIKSYRVNELIVGSEKEEIFSKRLCGRIFHSVHDDNGTNAPSCQGSYFSTQSIIYLSFAGFFCAIFVIASFFTFSRRDAVIVSALVVLFGGIILVATAGIPFLMGVEQFETMKIFLLVMIQMIVACVVMILVLWAERDEK